MDEHFKQSDLQKSDQPNNMEDERTKESFRQNASFAEKILFNEGMFSHSSDDYDIKKVTRVRIENMLYANLLQQTEVPVSTNVTNIGRQGINQWIWDNNVLKNIPTNTLKKHLHNKKRKDAFYYRNEYLLVLELTQSISEYLKLPVHEILDEHLLDQEVWSYLSTSFATTKSKQGLIKSLITSTTEVARYDVKEVLLLFPPIKKRKFNIVHPKVELYTKQLMKEGKSKLTIKTYMNDINCMLSWLVNNMKDFTGYELHNVPILSIKEFHLQEFRSYLLMKQRKGEYNSITISECIYDIKNFFAYLKKSFGFRNPARKLKSIKAPRYHFRDLPTEEQLIEFFNVIDMYSESPLFESVAFQLMVTLGLRSMEVSHVSWNDINMGTKTIMIQSKGGKYHILPLAGKLYRNLEMCQRFPLTNKYLFGDDPVKIVSQLKNNYKLYSHVAGWNFSGGLHLFRHCFVTNLAGKNSPPQILKELSRVVKMDTVSLYTHLNQRTNWLSQQINKLDYSPQGGK
ncbi:tyrosine-type recombinase/integrase [Paenibacillus albidus]|uniref:tyrosine-type recombinase/integrase n=1 Tax=Paenibacillus albidus TaxID=2041023 RepID=UPI001BEAF75C|nr:site-specific integrase [Paenibacillus albidus]MBT2293719.1 tyrosine-type recombinase/integrase [Paenibacillus albidus]